MSPAWTIAREQWRLLLRDRVAVLGMALWLLLGACAAFTAWDQRSAAQAQRERHQAQVDGEFEAQPDRHPHRMVHYGHFVFRPLSPLAAFDPGIDPYTGHTLFLEGHRQNSANFGDVRQSSLLLRFGQLTPAFVLQVLAPLLLVFMGHACVARERESGTLRMLLAQGVGAGHFVAGKLLALAGVAALMLAPAWLALAWIAVGAPQAAGPAIVLAAGHGGWLALWCVAIVAVSAFMRRGCDALLALLAAWAVCVVLVPRLAPEIVASSLVLPTRLETDIAIARELAALGDSHDPDDPYFADFRRKVLAQYGVSRVEDLPVNYKGLVAMEGERLTSALFEHHAHSAFGLQQEQLRRADGFALASPLIALRRLSMAVAGTDLHGYQRFLEQAEQHRYRMVQSLNRLQAEHLSHAGDRSSRDDRISHAHWQGVAGFHPVAEPPQSALYRALPAAGVLLAWLAVLVVALGMAVRGLGRATR